MPGLVTSMDVAPPMRTENLGIKVSRIALIFFRFAKSGSHFVFSSKGACWPNAEYVIWLPRSSIASPQTFSTLNPASATAFLRELTIFSFSSGVKSSE